MKYKSIHKSHTFDTYSSFFPGANFIAFLSRELSRCSSGRDAEFGGYGRDEVRNEFEAR